MLKNQYYIYILANQNNNVLYIGVTNDLQRRIFEHKNKLIDGFTKKYNIDKLVYFEIADCVEIAIEREKQLKKWRKEKKIILVNANNSNWDDLSLNWQ